MALSIKPNEWPEPDRMGWAAACKPHVRLRRGGRAAHLAPATREDLERRFGLFLGFLDRNRLLDRGKTALAQITPGTIAGYIADLRTRSSSVNVHGSIYKLRRVAEILDPSLDLAGLKEIEQDLSDRATPKSKADTIISSVRLFEAGIDLIRKAEAETSKTPLQRARMARNGLLVAFLAVCPIRLKNLASLRIATTIVRQHGSWWVLLPASDTKSGRLDYRELPEILTSWIDRYIETFKPIFPVSETAIWPSQYGGPMSASGIARLVSDTTRATLGKAINPHAFRHSVPYTIANLDGSRIRLASAVLQHSDPRTTEKHYNLGQSVEASRTFTEIVSNLGSPPKEK